MPISSDTSDVRIYFMRPLYFGTAIVCLISFFTCFAGSIAGLVAGFLIQPESSAAFCFFLVFWAGWMALSVWLLALASRHRIVLADSWFEVKGVFAAKRCDHNAVERVEFKWNNKIVVFLDGRNLRLDLSNYSRLDQQDIIEYFSSEFADCVIHDRPKPMSRSAMVFRALVAGCALAIGIVGTIPMMLDTVTPFYRIVAILWAAMIFLEVYLHWKARRRGLS